MKRLLLSLCCLLAFFGNINAQAYYCVQSTGTTSPYLYNTAGTDLLTTGNEVLSTWQTLPFAWNFYGAAVTGYYASDNGYITFDNTASTSIAANASIPAAGDPNNAIYAFWDDFTVDAASGNPDKVRSWTYGSAPDRVHCIQWWSMTPFGTTSWIYVTIRIYEGGDFDIVMDYSAATSLSGTLGCENAAGNDATQVAGSPSLTFPTLGTASTDDKVYTFHYGVQNAYDASVVSSGFSGTCDIGNNTVTGTISNLGTTTITSLRLNYSIDGAAAVSTTLNALNITGSGGTYNFSHPTAWNVPTGGVVYNLQIWADNLNGSNPDQDISNDTLSQDLLSNLGITAPKTVLIEEFTGAWCGWCPDGAVVLEGIMNTHPNDVVGVSVHDADQMEFVEGLRTPFAVSSYPSGMVDRYKFSGEVKVPCSRGAWSSYTTQRLSAYTPVEVTVEAIYNSGTRAVQASVTADFVDYAVGDLRIGLMVVEDSVVGTGTGFNQVNYLNTQAGHPYYNAGDPIIGFVHRQVLREIPSGAMGASGVIPGTTSPGGSYTYTNNFTLDNAYDDSKVFLVGWVYDYRTDVLKGSILNAGKSYLTAPAGINDATANNEGIIVVAPNPVSSTGYALMKFTKTTSASVEVYNVTGQRIAVLGEGNYAAGEHTVYFDVTDVDAGMYFLVVTTPDKTYSEKISVVK